MNALLSCAVPRSLSSSTLGTSTSSAPRKASRRWTSDVSSCYVVLRLHRVRVSSQKYSYMGRCVISATILASS